MTTISRAAQFAQRTAHLRASTIREMLKVTQQPDIISFGGGLPAPELFPTAAIADATRAVMERLGPAALQYSVTEGIPEMRAWVAERLTRRFGRIFDAESVTIVNGSQQGLDLVGKIFSIPAITSCSKIRRISARFKPSTLIRAAISRSTPTTRD